MNHAPLQLPRDAVLPDYFERGLYPLAHGIQSWLAGQQVRPPFAERDTRVLVLLVIDGLGDALLHRFAEPRRSSLLAHRTGRITSVLPSTTASAVTSLLTGLAPATHGLTGWHIHDRRFGGVIAPLPMQRRGGGRLRAPFLLQRLFPYARNGARPRLPTTMVSPQDIAHSPFSRRHARGAGVRPYRGLDQLAGCVEDEVRRLRDTGGLVHAYYASFDAICHHYGCHSPQARDCFQRVDDCFSALLARLKGTGAELILTADHGFIDAPDEKRLRLERHPALQSMLAAPLFGERRLAFSLARAGAEPEIAAYARDHFGGKLVLVPSEHLVRAGLLGPGPAHRRLAERVGSHAWLMEPGWTVSDRVVGEVPPTMIGVHGGMTADEMWVPLIQASC
ncbi:alkaline phosphatase family protein [Azoarcus olearius]|uniref:Phosphodiesterase protein n=1 Tax=Azoarcus sp. (strain BH72) TaxID=418699 RepID=A1K612_AZOSB|nr:alkaline phosphatase family protein [Azoarcus olearius]ANQ84817.1 putative phosphodiesterase [Azoarcus olearius]CAL94267.1 putative phosphodiesterase protein [Azoarcus olearius]